MKIVYFALTNEGRKTAERIRKKLGGVLEPKENFSRTVSADFHRYDAMVFVMAAGIVVRTIAPLIRNKTSDPAVVVLDQNGEFAVSLLSGHLGGANNLTRLIAEATGAVPVITTATDVQGVISFDEFAKKNNLVIENISELKYISGALLDGEKASFLTDCPVNIHNKPECVEIAQKPVGKYRVIVSDSLRTDWTEGAEHVLFLRPCDLVLGIGCKRMTEFSHLENCFLKLLEKYQLSVHSVRTAATVSLKSKEPAILKLCEKYGLEMKIIADKDIKNCEKEFESSEFVQQVTGLPSVAQACSYLASECGEELTGKVRFSGVTMAVCRKKIKKLEF